MDYYYISFLKVKTDVTLTKYLETSSSRDRVVPFIVRDEFNGGPLVAACLASGVAGSMLGLVGPVSVFSDWLE